MKRFAGLIVFLVGGASALAQQQAAPYSNLSTPGIASAVNVQIAPGAAFVSL